VYPIEEKEVQKCQKEDRGLFHEERGQLYEPEKGRGAHRQAKGRKKNSEVREGKKFAHIRSRILGRATPPLTRGEKLTSYALVRFSRKEGSLGEGFLGRRPSGSRERKEGREGRDRSSTRENPPEGERKFPPMEKEQ